MARAKIFRHGGSQAVRLPKEFRFDVAEVDVRKDGDSVILEPVKVRKAPTQAELDALWARIDALKNGDEFPEREQPAPQERDFGS